MKTKSPPTRRAFAGEWDEIAYLYDKLLYWLYDRGDLPRASRFGKRLEKLLAKRSSDGETIRGEECRSLLCELHGDLRGAIKHRANEIRLIRRLHEVALDTPGRDAALGRYDFSDLSDRLDLLAILYHDAGDLDRAIGLLKESKQLCRAHAIAFEGQDLLDDYLAEQSADGRAGPKHRRSRSVTEEAETGC